jgi:sugar phosphate isomerase/epimerase
MSDFPGASQTPQPPRPWRRSRIAVDTSDFPIACQTITWGAEQCDKFPEVFAQVAEAGFAGVEIGFRHIRQTPPTELASMLEGQGLALAASHVGGNLFDARQADQERGILDEVMDYLQATGTKLLMYSGLRYQSDDQLSSDIAMLNRAAQACAARGIQLLYHNHDFEFADDGRVIRALIANTGPLGFCPDIGWVKKGGADVIGFLDEIKDRIGAVHFKDFATMEHCCDTVILGRGVAPLAETAAWLKTNKTGLWVIAEQDNADVPPEEAAAGNAAYLKSVFV